MKHGKRQKSVGYHFVGRRPCSSVFFRVFSVFHPWLYSAAARIGEDDSLMGERFSMNTDPIQLVDRGRGLQLSTSRITVLDVFYYLHRGYDFAVIHDIMPSLTREEFDVIAAYVKDHNDELAEKDRR